MLTTPAPSRLALVTGASRGLGSALAELLSTEYHIVAVARTTGGLEELDDRIQARGGQATLAPMDIAQDAAMQHLCRSIHDRWGGLDLWIHTAIHAAPLCPAGQSDAKDFDKSIATNATATQRLITYVDPLLRGRSGGTAVFFDDPNAGGTAFHGVYGASKAAQMTLVRSWQAETHNLEPNVMVLTPPPMPTGLRARFHPGEDRAALTPIADAAAAIRAQLP